jgi:epoxyqueuosine reductase
MAVITMSEWEKKYIPEPIVRFDQRNRANMRVEWDPAWGNSLGTADALAKYNVLKKFNARIEIKDEPGYGVVEAAFLNTVLNAGRFRGSIEQPETFEGAAEACRVNVTVTEGRAFAGDAEKLTRDVRKLARYFGADTVGICRLDRRWIYSHSYKRLELQGRGYPDAIIGESRPLEIPDEFQYAVVMVVNQDYNLLKYSPAMISSASNFVAYTRLTNANLLLSAFVQNLGYKAVALPTHQIARHIPLAMQAGLGDIGRNGLLISPEFGPRAKITTMVTDLPLVVDSPIDFGITEFCAICRKCARLCPAQALPYGDRSTEPSNASNSAGELKWRVNAEKCAMYWANGHMGCNTCVACCPFVRTEDSLKYTKLLRADSFWDEWQPVPYATGATV